MSRQMLPSISLARCLTVNRSVSEEVDNKAGEVDEEMLERALSKIKLQVFRPCTWVVSRCKLEVQIEVDFKHAKDMF